MERLGSCDTDGPSTSLYSAQDDSRLSLTNHLSFGIVLL